MGDTMGPEDGHTVHSRDPAWATAYDGYSVGQGACTLAGSLDNDEHSQRDDDADERVE
jgi:hypothetical protein